jgi:hypothetical protein
MSLAIRLKNRSTGQPVVADDDDAEFDNIYNLLGGVSLDKSIRVRSNDAAFATARFDQLAAANILELYRNGASKVRFNMDGNLVFEHGDDPSILLTNTDASVNLLIRVLDTGILSFGNFGVGDIFTADLATRVLTFLQQPIFPNNKTVWSANWVIPDMASRSIDGNFDLLQGVLIPNGNVTLTHIEMKATSGTASGSFSVEVRKAPFGSLSQTTLGTLTLNPGTIGVGVEVDVADHTFTALDHLYIVVTAKSSPLHKAVWVSARGYQTFSA